LFLGNHAKIQIHSFYNHFSLLHDFFFNFLRTKEGIRYILAPYRLDLTFILKSVGYATGAPPMFRGWPIKFNKLVVFFFTEN
jgi:hypothetical protein